MLQYPIPTRSSDVAAFTLWTSSASVSSGVRDGSVSMVITGVSSVMMSPVVSAGEDSSVFPSSVSSLLPDSPDGSEPLGCAGWLGVSASPDDSGVPDGSELPDGSRLPDDS